MSSSYASGRVKTSTETGTSALPSPTTPVTGTRSNALQNRITNVLSASFADLEIRDALSILDQRGLQNSADTRRNLRLDVQEQMIRCNGEIVQDFGKVAQQLKRIGTTIASLNNSCAAMRKHIATASRETGPMLEEARTILKDKAQVEAKQKLLSAFSAHFIISDTELATLTSTAEPVNDDFFRILTRVKRIHHDSQVLLGLEDQRSGLEILEQSSRQLNAAYQKLFRWVQREFKSLDLENPHLNTAIRRSLRVLAERPALFQNCLDFFVESREQILSNNFYASLTGTPVDQDHPVMGKAIELSAHDPLRYISDMLAWAHSATVSEREALEVLFISDGDEIARNIQAGLESERWSQPDENDEAQVFDGRKALREVVDRVLAGVFRQLKQRSEQVIQTHEDATLAYKVSNIIIFYTNMFTPLLGENSALLETLQPLSETAMRAFRSTMRDHAASLQSDLSLTTADDLRPPEFLNEALDTLQALMRSYDTSVLNTSRTQRIEGFQPILTEALDPFLAACEGIATRLRSPKSAIFALNCLFATKDTLSVYAFADRSAELQPRLDQYELDLTEATHAWFLRESGLKTLVESVATADDLSSSYKDPASLASMGQQLDAFLPTATEDARTFLAQLENKIMVRSIIEKAAEQFCDDFEGIEALVVQADEIRAGQLNGDLDEEVWLREVFPRTGDEIRVLLS